MEMVGGSAGMHGHARRSRPGGRAAEQARVIQRGALRRGRLALPRSLACGLQRAHFVRGCIDWGVGGGDGVAWQRRFPGEMRPRRSVIFDSTDAIRIFQAEMHERETPRTIPSAVGTGEAWEYNLRLCHGRHAVALPVFRLLLTGKRVLFWLCNV